MDTQEKVASISNDSGLIACDPNDPYKILTKPHGHGDIHIDGNHGSENCNAGERVLQRHLLNELRGMSLPSVWGTLQTTSETPI